MCRNVVFAAAEISFVVYLLRLVSAPASPTTPGNMREEGSCGSRGSKREGGNRGSRKENVMDPTGTSV